jgi:large subunit ribosomal protein L23
MSSQAGILTKIIKRPIITEKSMELTEHNKYTFEVPMDATKPQIKAAVEKLFEVSVKKVNICRMFGSSRRSLKGRTKPRDSKKAIVTIDGDHIKYFPEV